MTDGDDVDIVFLRRRFHTVAEVFFAAEAPTVLADLVELIQSPRPVAGARCTDFYTILLDLTLDEDALRGGIGKGAQYKIRRAPQRDGVIYHSPSDLDAGALRRFLAFSESFVPAQGLARLRSQAAAGVLELSMVSDRERRDLVWHAYYRSRGRVRLLHSVSARDRWSDSAFSNLVGRANRYHHWQDILHFKADGLETYDFGGWYEGVDDRHKLGINAFKESFGGEIVRNFNCTLAISPRGVLVMSWRQLRKLRRRVVAPGPA